MSRFWAAIRSNPYGCVMICVAALAMVATLPGRTHGLGMITERLLKDPAFELDRVTYADMNLWATLLGGLFCLPCGYLIDRFGLRVTLTATVAALGATVVWMTSLTGWWALFVSLVLTRGFGQSALSVISITIVGKWYTGRLSMPMAIYTLLLSLGFAFAPQFAKPYADDNWRVVWGGMGDILLLGMTPLALLLTRDPVRKPTDQEEDDRAQRAEISEAGFTLFQAMRTQAFWVFGIAISVIALIGSGQSLFNQSVLEQQGFKPEVFYDLITLVGIVGMVVKLPVGWIGQHWQLNRLHAVGLFLLATCLVLLPQIRSTSAVIHIPLLDLKFPIDLVFYGIGMGVSGTITTVLFFSVWGQAFGRTHLGQIQSVAQMMTVLASAAGPKVYAECFERYHSYAPAFQVLSGIVFLLAVWSLMIHMPSPNEARQENQVAHTLAAQESPA